MERSKAIYGDFYDYSKAVYKHAKQHVIITCPIHGDFLQKPKDHWRGVGCAKCSSLREGARRRAAKAATFEERAKAVPRDKIYSYHLVEYINNSTPVIIVCPEHGPFQQVPSDHLKGRGCPKCQYEFISKLKTIPVEEIEKRLLSRPGQKYTYDLSGYTNTDSKIRIKCPIHGWFEQQFTNHMNGTGCPKCMKCGFNTSKPGWLYVMKADNLYKIGVTNRAVKSRLHEIRKSSGKEFETVAAILFENGAVTDAIETSILDEYRKSHKQLTEAFSGSTECFYDVDFNQLLLRISQIGCEVFNQLSLIKE